jgi:predicted dehydrogenase
MALQHGKAVFLEKPMVTTHEQLVQIVQFLQKNPALPFCVDYNRSFAPFIQRIKKALNTRTSPLMIAYRMNAGFIPKSHWTQTEVGAGRIIGEACHIFDLFCYLTDSTPVSVSVESLKPNNEDLFATDNVSVQLSFADGSVCSLLYTALGHSKMGKERMEIYFDSKTIIMDDYKKLEGFGLPASFNTQASVADKGHETLLKLFFESLQHTQIKPIIDLDRLVKVSEISLIVDKLACKGGGQTTL